MRGSVSHDLRTENWAAAKTDLWSRRGEREATIGRVGKTRWLQSYKEWHEIYCTLSFHIALKVTGGNTLGLFPLLTESDHVLCVMTSLNISNRFGQNTFCNSGASSKRRLPAIYCLRVSPTVPPSSLSWQLLSWPDPKMTPKCPQCPHLAPNAPPQKWGKQEVIHISSPGQTSKCPSFGPNSRTDKIQPAVDMTGEAKHSADWPR